jgi:hypothetical protein
MTSGSYRRADRSRRQEHPILSRVESMSAGQVGDSNIWWSRKGAKVRLSVVSLSVLTIGTDPEIG